MTNTSQHASELRDLRKVLQEALIFFGGMKSFRVIDGIANIAPDLPLGDSSNVDPQLLAKLEKYFSEPDVWQECDEHLHSVLLDALARLDAVLQAIQREG